jgi:phage host-nuclease inhibitor protein Gam
MTTEAFTVRDLDSLEWYVDKLASIEDRKARIKAQADAMVHDLERDAESLKFQFADQAQKVLRELLQQPEHAHRKSKHIKFLTGTIGLRSVPARLVVTNQAQAVQFLRTLAPEVIETRVNALAFAARFKPAADQIGLTDTDTGESARVQGFMVQPTREALYVKTSKTSDSEDAAAPSQNPSEVRP